MEEDDLFDTGQNPVKQADNRTYLGRWKKGQSGNPFGRPKGKTMKDWAREYLSKMNDGEREAFMDGLSKDVIWKMAEGNWQQDVTSGGERIIPLPIIPLNKDALPTNNSNEQNSKPL